MRTPLPVAPALKDPEYVLLSEYRQCGTSQQTARGGEVLAPGRPERFLQFIDVRDLAEWTVRMVERQESGVYNANGLARVVTDLARADAL